MHFNLDCSSRAERPFPRGGALLVILLGACAHSTPVPAPSPAAPMLEPGTWDERGGHACYIPPDFGATESPARRRSARNDALQSSLERWQGRKDPAFEVPAQRVNVLESLLLTQPDLIEGLVVEDYTRCVQWREGKLDLDTYLEWYSTAIRMLGQEVCAHPSYDVITQYVDVSRPWEVETPLCKGERLSMVVSSGEYAIHGAAPGQEPAWLTASGDPSRPAGGLELPCTVEGCLEGQLVGRFQDRAGQVTYFPVGLEARFMAPAHGTVSLGINDSTPADNQHRIQEGVKDFVRVELRPVESEGGGASMPVGP